MKTLRSLLAFSAVLLLLTLVAAPAQAKNKAPSPKSGKTVPSTGHTGTPAPGGSGASTPKQPPHSNQGPVNLPGY